MENTFQEEISVMDKFRYSLIEKENNKTATPEEIEQIDNLANEIGNWLQKYQLFLPFEFIMEQLSRLGDAPSLLYDDDGHWCVTSDGFQNVIVDGPADWEGVFTISKELWKNTPREALEAYLSQNDEED